MSAFIKQLIEKKLNQITTEELLNYSKQYGFSISEAEAKEIVSYVKTHQINPFSPDSRAKLIKDLAKITNIKTAKKAQKLFNEIIKSYGLESMFY